MGEGEGEAGGIALEWGRGGGGELTTKKGGDYTRGRMRAGGGEAEAGGKALEWGGGGGGRIDHQKRGRLYRGRGGVEMSVYRCCDNTTNTLEFLRNRRE